MGDIYILHSGVDIIEDSVKTSIYTEQIITINPTIKSLPLRILRKVHFSIRFRSEIWADTLLDKYDIDDKENTTLIIFDAPIWITNIEYIRKKYKNVKIVFWFWNIVKQQYINKINTIKNNVDDIYTFDEEEALKFNFIHHVQFYWLTKIEKNTIIYDVLFIGKNKNRIEFLEKIYFKLNAIGLKSYFYILKDTESDTSKYIDLKSASICYSDVLKLISRSGTILDINQSNQVGFTLRVLEALFFKKKLLTNNKNIMTYDFYKKNNIQIINNDLDIDVSFFENDYEKIDNTILEQYTFDHWIERLVYSSIKTDKNA